MGISRDNGKENGNYYRVCIKGFVGFVGFIGFRVEGFRGFRV